MSPDGVQVNASGADLVFLIKETGEKITVRGWRQGEALSRVEFADGTVWNGKDMDTNTLRGTDGNDVLTGMNYIGETLIGGKGNDIYFAEDKGLILFRTSCGC